MDRDDPPARSRQSYWLTVVAIARDQIVGQTEWGAPVSRSAKGDICWFTPGSGL